MDGLGVTDSSASVGRTFSITGEVLWPDKCIEPVNSLTLTVLVMIMMIKLHNLS